MTSSLSAISAGVPSAILRPKFKTAIRSHTLMTARMLCSMYITVIPRVRISRMGSRTWFYFLTYFTDGAWVMTSSRPLSPQDSEQFAVAGLAAEPRDVLILHQEQVQRFRGRGHHPSPHLTREARLEACRAYYASSYSRRKQGIDGISRG